MTNDNPHAPPDEAAIRQILRRVIDPEVGMNIVDLGLVYGVDVADGVIGIDLTMTTAACPMTDMIVDDVRTAVAGVAPPDARVDVRLVWDPPWTPDRMSGIAKDHFGWN